jgi:hypothetical protein
MSTTGITSFSSRLVVTSVSRFSHGSELDHPHHLWVDHPAWVYRLAGTVRRATAHAFR